VAAILIMMLAATASASSIVYDTTDSTNTGFNGLGGVLTLNSTSGVAATLVYTAVPDSTVGVPTNINLGKFVLTCAACGASPSGASAVFASFTFDLFVSLDTPTTDTGVGEFIGTSTGGTAWSNSSNIAITWSPLLIGPGTTGATSGNFGTSIFTVTSPTLIVSPNTNLGTTTVQGAVLSAATPEPATMAMAGGLLIGLAGMARRKRRS
jgi:hypothetical protein